MGIIKRIPLPIVGLMLALAAAGNLVQSYSEIARNCFGIISGIIFVLVTIKILTNIKGFIKEMENPVMASVFPTYSMGLMILTTYLKPYFPAISARIWMAAVSLHVFMIIFFTLKFAIKRNIKTVFPSWFILYVGIVVASVTAKAFGKVEIGQWTFWFGLISYIILLPLVLYRVYKVKEIPKPAQPTFAILAAPGSLLVAGYLSSFENKNIILFYTLLIVSQLLYVAVLGNLPRLIELEFMPSFSGFTFPLIISAMAIKMSGAFLSKSQIAIPGFTAIIFLEIGIGILIALYVLYKYTMIISNKNN